MRDLSTSNVSQHTIIGLTGGMGSGKSTVAKIFQSLGVPCWDADKAGKFLYDNNAPLRNQVVQAFGREIGIYHDSELVGIHRKVLAQRVFGNPEDLKVLNALVHPAVDRAFHEWCLSEAPAHAPYVIRESAILFESSAERDCSSVITVQADESTRVERIQLRDALDLITIRKRLEHQWTDEQRAEASEYVLFNGESDRLLRQVVALNHVLKDRFQ